MPTLVSWLVLITAFLAGASSLAQEDFPPLTAAERDLTTVDFDPEARAVPGTEGHFFTYRFRRSVRGRYHASRGAIAALAEIERLAREAEGTGIALLAP